MHTATFNLAHLSDSHLGYEAYPALSPSGNNQRGEDMVRAFVNVCDDILSWDPALVIHAGDVTEKPKVDIKYMLVAQQYFTRLAGKRSDGSRRQVIIVAGNHEQPRSRKEICWLELLRGIPGVRVVSDTYRIERYRGGVDDCPFELDGVAIHALPHDSLKEIDQSVVVPDEKASANVLVAHGVAMGSELFTRALGREYAIDADMLSRDWDYVSLGHFHKRGPVASGTNPAVERVWYSGSSENVSFRDLRDNNAGKGYLRVALRESTISVNPVNLPIRRMFRLPVVQGSNKSAEELTRELRENLECSDIEAAVVGQIVEGVSTDMWSLLDLSAVREAAKAALHYELTVRHSQAAPKEHGDNTVGLGDLGRVLDEHIMTSVEPRIVDDVRDLARMLLGSALNDVADDSPTKTEATPPTTNDKTPDSVVTAGEVAA